MAGAGGALTPDTNDTVLSFVKKVTSYLQQDTLDLGQLNELRSAMSELEKMASKPKDCTDKVFNDPIHGNMGFPSLCVKIIDTPQFQRLRHIKQLGGGYFVYPDASHNRFEHSLGVCHLAGLLVTELRDRQPTLEITPQDVLCVQIAGLCHDLGHGPFSHVFDNKFIPAVKREEEKRKREREREEEREKEGIPADKPWKHEDASLAMFDHMVKVNKLEDDFGKCHLTHLHRKFIKALIVGEPTKELLESDWDTKSKKKAFLFEIVANKRNGVDVDKWDYFQRDCHHLGMTSSFDLTRFIKFARVITVNDPDTKKEETSDTEKEETSDTKKEETSDTKKEETSDTEKEETSDTKKEETSDTKKEETSDTEKEETSDTEKEETSDTKKEESQICYRDKEAFNMYQLFHTRFTLHRRAYQHKTVQAVELMLVDAMKAANVFLKIPGDNNEYFIADCIGHMDAYTNLTDEIFHQIMLSKADSPLGEEATKEELARAEERARARELARKTLQDIQQRKLYKCVGEIVIPVLGEEYMPKIENPEEVIKELILKETKKPGQDKLDERIRIQVSTLDYGKKAKNPVNDVRFWKKSTPDKAEEFKAVEVSFLVPQFCFMEHLVRVFFKTGADDKSDEKKLIAKLQTVCQEWCAQELKNRTEDLEESPPPVHVDLGSNFIKDHAKKIGKQAYLTFCPTFRKLKEM